MKPLFLPEAVNDTLWIFLGSFRWLLVSYVVVVNLVAFAMMGIDKRRAKKAGAWRISEKSLFLSAFLGGSVGAIVGMRLFRHKTKHWYFVWGMPLILIAQIALVVWMFVL